MDEIGIKEYAIAKAYDFLERNQIEKDHLTDCEWQVLICLQEQRIKDCAGY